MLTIYSVTCPNRIALGPNFSAGLDRNPDYKELMAQGQNMTSVIDRIPN